VVRTQQTKWLNCAVAAITGHVLNVVHTQQAKWLNYAVVVITGPVSNVVHTQQAKWLNFVALAPPNFARRWRLRPNKALRPTHTGSYT